MSPQYVLYSHWTLKPAVLITLLDDMKTKKVQKYNKFETRSYTSEQQFV